MKKNQSTYTVAFFILVFVNSFLSCKKEWLEEKYDIKQSVPTTLNDFQLLLDNDLRMNNNVCGWGEIAADGHFVTEAVWNGATSDAARNAYTWSRDRQYSANTGWSAIYLRIYTCNVVLGGLEKIKSTQDVGVWENIKGQALFNRAEAFFGLSQLFSQPYSENSAINDIGIPLRLNADITGRSNRASVRQTIDQIIQDVKLSATLLPLVSTAPTRAGRSAAYALLARVYLIMGDYESSLLYADSCLQFKGDLLDFNVIPANASSIGSIFSNPLLNPEMIFYNRMFTSLLSNFLTTGYLVESSLYNEYTQQDIRRTRYFRVNVNNTITFKGNYNNSTTALFCGIAVDEVYLIKAECLARKGQTVGAMNTLNVLLRKRHDVSFVDYSANDSEEALTKILQERRKELVLRNLRWSDLRRLNFDDRYKITITRTIGGQTYTLEPGSYKYTFPIPDEIIAISGMPQSSGW